MSEQSIPGVGDALGEAGGCPEVNLGGRVWKVGHPTQAAKSRLEKLAAARAVNNVLALRDVLPAAEYDQLWKSTLAAVQAGKFKTWREGWRDIVFGDEAAGLFFLSLLQQHHPDATETDALALAAGAPEQVAAAIAQVVPGFLSVLLEGVPMTPLQREQVGTAVSGILTRLQQPTPPSI